MQKRTYAIPLLAAAAIILPVFAASAQVTTAHPQWSGRGRGGVMGMGLRAGMVKPVVAGSVTAVSGNTLTVTDTKSGTSYTVDATNAKVTKNRAASTVSAIAVGDTVAVQGTVSGTTVTATAILDGKFMPGAGKRGGKTGVSGSATAEATDGGRDENKEGGAPVAPIAGNGQPVIMGTVASVSGSSFTITNSGGVTYTIDASAAKITKSWATVKVADIVVGDRVLIQGTVNGTSIVAVTVTDQSVVRPPAAAPSGDGSQQQTPPPAPAGGNRGASHGFFGWMGNFFSHLFGF